MSGLWRRGHNIHNATLRNDEILQFAMIWLALEDTMLNEGWSHLPVVYKIIILGNVCSKGVMPWSQSLGRRNRGKEIKAKRKMSNKSNGEKGSGLDYIRDIGEWYSYTSKTDTQQQWNHEI